MANDWATADTFDAIRLNQKTRFIGTGLQATTFLTSPQIGQMVYPTLNDSTATGDTTLQDAFRHEKFSFYTSAGWKHHTPQETEYSVGNSVSTQARTDAGTGHIFFMFTLPSTDKYYKISAIEFGHDVTPAVVYSYVCLLPEADPSTNWNFLPVVATAGGVSMGGAFGDATKITTMSSKPILPGSFLAVGMVAAGSNTAGFGATSAGGTSIWIGNFGGVTNINACSNLVNNSGSRKVPAVKVYYIGYS